MSETPDNRETSCQWETNYRSLTPDIQVARTGVGVCDPSVKEWALWVGILVWWHFVRPIFQPWLDTEAIKSQLLGGN